MSDARDMLLGLARAYGVGDDVADLIEFAPDPDVPTLADLLRTAREEKGLTLENVNKRCGLSRSQLSYYETGIHKNPGIRTCKQLAKGYGLPLAAVLLSLYREIRLPTTHYERTQRLRFAPGAKVRRRRRKK